jgi:hypothetical protein
VHPADRPAAAGPPPPPRCAWVYAGSHNLSGAAWGKVEDADDEADGRELVCMSYELGVLIVPPTPVRLQLPWRSPALPYDPEKVRPFATNRYNAILRGSRSGAYASHADEDAARAADDAKTEWRQQREWRQQAERRRQRAWWSCKPDYMDSGGGGAAAGAAASELASADGQVAGAGADWQVAGAGADWHVAGAGVDGQVAGAGELPRALRMPLAEVRKLRKLRVVAENAVVVHAAAPSPGSEGRRRARHLLRSGSGDDDLLKVRQLVRTSP